MSGFVYMWINKINDKKYIGSHIGDVNDSYIGSGTAFMRAVKKYGIEKFERIILECIEDNMLVREREQYYIDLHNAAYDKNYYNIKPKAGGGFEYINQSPELKEKSKKANENLWSRKQHPKGFFGKKHSTTSWEKTRTGWKDWADKKLKRPVLQFDLEMNLIKEHESITAAARSVKGNPSNIKYTIEGSFNKAYGYKWEYKK